MALEFAEGQEPYRVVVALQQHRRGGKTWCSRNIQSRQPDVCDCRCWIWQHYPWLKITSKQKELDCRLKGNVGMSGNNSPCRSSISEPRRGTHAREERLGDQG